MTATAPGRLIHDEPPALAAPMIGQAAAGGACPVRLLGQRLALVAAELDRLGDKDEGGSGSVTDKYGRDDQLDMLIDATDHLAAEVQWLTPRSAEGVMIVALLLHTAGEDLRDFHDAPGLSHGQLEPVRRFNRLHARLMEGINHLAGKTPTDIGLDRYWLDRPLTSALAAAFASID